MMSLETEPQQIYDSEINVRLSSAETDLNRRRRLFRAGYGHLYLIDPTRLDSHFDSKTHRLIGTITERDVE
jgi:hypothetical protein